MSKKTLLITHSITYCILIGLLLIATFYDQKISESIYVGGGIAVVGSVVGKLPAWIMACMAGGILFKSALYRDKSYKARIPLIIIYIIGTYICSFIMGIDAVDDILHGSAKLVAATVICVAAGSSALLFANMVSMDNIMKLKKWAMLTLICVASISVVILLVKIGWGRERFVDIINDDKIFTPWYLPQGIKQGGTSMPSGHTALASCTFLLPLLFMSLPNMKQYTTSTYLLAWVIIFFIALTRMLGGHHFLSDVVLSILVSYTIILTVFMIGYGKNLDKTMLKENGFLAKF